MGMNDREFLKKLVEKKIHWTYEDLQQAKRLRITGHTKYVSDMTGGWWEITTEGKKLIGT